MKKISSIYFHLSIFVALFFGSYGLFILEQRWHKPFISFLKSIYDGTSIFDPLSVLIILSLAFLPVFFFVYLLVYLRKLHAFYIDDNLDVFLNEMKKIPYPVYVFFAYFFITSAVKYLLKEADSNFEYAISVISILAFINLMCLEKILIWENTN